MQFQSTDIADVVTIDPVVFGDHRGFFLETYHRQKFADAGLDVEFVQDKPVPVRERDPPRIALPDQTAAGQIGPGTAGRGVRRGSRPPPQFTDVWKVGRRIAHRRKTIVGCIPGAPRFCPRVSASNRRQRTSSTSATDLYAPEHERTLLWNDPAVGIDWPLSGEPVLSEKDTQGVPLSEAECYE